MIYCIMMVMQTAVLSKHIQTRIPDVCAPTKGMDIIVKSQTTPKLLTVILKGVWPLGNQTVPISTPGWWLPSVEVSLSNTLGSTPNCSRVRRLVPCRVFSAVCE